MDLTMVESKETKKRRLKRANAKAKENANFPTL